LNLHLFLEELLEKFTSMATVTEEEYLTFCEGQNKPVFKKSRVQKNPGYSPPISIHLDLQIPKVDMSFFSFLGLNVI